MNKKLHLIASYCAIFMTIALVTISCAKDEKDPVDQGDKDKDKVDTVFTISATLDTLMFENSGGEQSVTINAKSAGWDLKIVGGEGWLTTDIATAEVAVNDSIGTVVKVIVEPNDVEAIREGYVLATQKGTGKTARIGVHQAPAPELETSRETDSLALVALFDALDGVNFFPDLWNFEKPITTWKNVVTEDGRVVELVFDNQDAKGDIPAELGTLRALRSLVFRVNRVKGMLPEGLAFARGMEKLDLYKSSGVISLPKNMGNWVNLHTLWISGSGVKALPLSMKNCTKVTVIAAQSLAKSYPIEGDASIFKDMSLLQMVEFSETALTGDISFLRNKPDLRIFDVTSSKMSGDINLTENLASVPNLEALKLGKSPNLSGTLAGLEVAPKLVMFELRDSKLSGELSAFDCTKTPLLNLLMDNNELTGNIPYNTVSKSLTLFNVGMNKLSGTLTDDVVKVIKARAQFATRVCVQKEGFGFTNCDALFPAVGAPVE